jgi:hypothetical protein
MSERKQRVELVKTSHVSGGLPIGGRFGALHDPAMPREDAIRRTYRLLKRHHPGENPMCWTVDSEAHASRSPHV